MIKTVYSNNVLTTSLALLVAVFISSSLKAQTSVMAVGADSVCVGDTATLAAMFTGSTSATFIWADTTGANSLSATSGDTVMAFPMVTTHYRIIGDTNGTKDTVYFTVKVNPIPTVSVSISDTMPCLNDTITLIGSGAASYKWYSTASATTPFATGDTVTDVPNGSRTYWAEGNSNGCIDKDSASMNMNFGPKETLSTKIGAIKASNQVCVDDSIQIYAQVGTNNYTWSSNLGSLSSTSGNRVYLKGLTSGQQATVTCKIDSSNGCSTTISEIFYAASVKAVASHSWLTDSVICQGDTARVQGFGASNFGGGYYWKPGSSAVDSLSNPVELVPMVSTTYYMEIVFNGCRSWDTLELMVNPVPDLALSKASTAPICKDEADTITITSTRGVLFDWGFGVISAQKVKAVTPGYTRFIVIKAFSAANCVTIDSIKIDVDTTCGGELSVREMAQGSINTFMDLDKKLNIQFGSVPPGNVEVELIDLTGAVAKRVDLGTIQNSDRAVIYCNDLNNGIYLLRIKGEEYEVVRKLLK